MINTCGPSQAPSDPESSLEEDTGVKVPHPPTTSLLRGMRFFFFKVVKQKSRLQTRSRAAADSYPPTGHSYQCSPSTRRKLQMMKQDGRRGWWVALLDVRWRSNLSAADAKRSVAHCYFCVSDIVLPLRAVLFHYATFSPYTHPTWG